MERMVNTRLVWYLEKGGFISKYQCGFRKQRNTTDHLLRLESYIRQAFKNGEQCVSIFFDLEKAYDTTWKHGILRDLHRAGIRGHMAAFISHFLADRQFQVRVGPTLSAVHELEMGVPQGSILSVTLFVLKINGLAEVIDKDFFRSLFVDDFQLSFKGKTMSTIERRMQPNLVKISKWADENGFKFSYEKTVCLHFWKYKASRAPELEMKGQPIKLVQKTKFLGLVWDRGLTFKDHILYLRGKCLKALNMLKVLSHTDWGADTQTLLKLFRCLVRSKLDYGSIVYTSASHASLKKLYSVQNEALRICCGAFRSSPIDSLHAECYEMPPKIRQLQLSLQYAITLRANRTNPAYDTIYLGDNPLFECLSDMPTSDEEDEDEEGEQKALFLKKLEERRRNLPPSFNERVREYAEEANIPFDDIAPNEMSPVEPWLLQSPLIDTRLTSSTKADTNPITYTTGFKELCDTYKGFSYIYTDGSKKDEKVGAAATWEFGTLKTRLPNGACIFSGEAVALINALKIIQESERTRFVIFTDSLSCLESLRNEDLSNSLIKEFLLRFREISQMGKCVVLCWIPSHKGIKGNEKADTHAKEALDLSIRPILIPSSDFKTIPKQYFTDLWHDIWTRSVSFRSIHSPTLEKKIYDPSLSRREERALCRLRIGHTRLTESYRMENRTARDKCSECDVGADLSVQHIMTECDRYRYLRERFLPGDTLEEIFSHPDRTIVEFLRETDLLKRL